MKLFKLIKLLIFVIVVGGLFLLFTNKTFVYDTYKNDDVKEGIPISRFMYVKENNLDVTFYTFVNKEKLERVKDEYLKSLDDCYGKYYYDKDNDITITNYEIKSNKYYKEVNISYVKKNYCSSDYKLSEQPKFVHVATLDEIKENEYNLNIPRYVDSFEEEELIDIAAVQANIARLKQEIAEAEAKMDAYLKELGL